MEACTIEDERSVYNKDGENDLLRYGDVDLKLGLGMRFMRG